MATQATHCCCWFLVTLPKFNGWNLQKWWVSKFGIYTFQVVIFRWTMLNFGRQSYCCLLLLVVVGCWLFVVVCWLVVLSVVVVVTVSIIDCVFCMYYCCCCCCYCWCCCRLFVHITSNGFNKNTFGKSMNVNILPRQLSIRVNVIRFLLKLNQFFPEIHGAFAVKFYDFAIIYWNYLSKFTSIRTSKNLDLPGHF